MSGSAEPTPVELHLGDRLAALIDGELEHEARERVLAHLATCPACKAEADAQRRVKTVCAGSAPPPPSDGLLARLQGLPMSGPGGEPDYVGPEGPGGPRTGVRIGIHYPLSSGVGGHQGGLSGRSGFGGSMGFGTSKGFRADRTTDVERVVRGRRFAFAAAGAVSLAAVALGGVLSAGQTATGGQVVVGPARAPAAGVERGERKGGEVALTERVHREAARPTTHSSPPAALGKRPGDALSKEARGLFGTGALGGRSGAAPYLPRFGQGGAPLLPPPLVLAAAHREGLLSKGSTPSARPEARPYAMPSANGSPAGPLPTSGSGAVG